jgi:uncharacterized paraquat-inducible protein A
MATEEKREATEEEFFFAEEAFVEHQQTGSTEKCCPRCGSEFRFRDYGSAHTVECSRCDFKVTARGL